MKAAHEAIQRPRGAKLLVVDAKGRMRHADRAQLADFLRAGDLLIANDAATLPASLQGVHVRSGKTIELRLASRRSLRVDDVREFTAVLFGEGDWRTPTEHRPLPPLVHTGDVLALGPLRAAVLRTLDHPRLVQIKFAGEPDAIWSGIARHGKPVQYAHVPESLKLWDVWTRVAALPVAFEPPSAGFVLDWALLAALKAKDIAFATLTHAAGFRRQVTSCWTAACRWTSRTTSRRRPHARSPRPAHAAAASSRSARRSHARSNMPPRARR